ncbi:REPTOR-binding partner isoform X1 [Drosophila hydei]|uniref:REPTOR-binding partner isoform X1 n=1 Tax=Drosophila hydei TaxID=7224 RepID=A0A6J1LH67_DROHY|nr:REPTOR-binding partner isoform X1 [Drosophila hydei]
MDCDSMQMAITEEHQLSERKESGRRGRKPGRKTSSEKVDVKAKLERSRQSARECRARKKLRYQYLEELVADREKAVIALRAELERFMQCDRRIEEMISPNDIDQLLKDIGIIKQEIFA